MTNIPLESFDLRHDNSYRMRVGDEIVSIVFLTDVQVVLATWDDGAQELYPVSEVRSMTPRVRMYV